MLVVLASSAQISAAAGLMIDSSGGDDHAVSCCGCGSLAACCVYGQCAGQLAWLRISLVCAVHCSPGDSHEVAAQGSC